MTAKRRCAGDNTKAQAKRPPKRHPWTDKTIPLVKLRPGATVAGKFAAESPPGEDGPTFGARSLMTPEIPAALVIQNFWAHAFPGGIDMTTLAQMIRQSTDRAARGELDGIVAQLVTQSAVLDSVAGDMFHRAALNVKTPQIAESYMRMGLRASAESRAKLEAVAEIKNPRPVYVRNLNQANNQQINQAGGPQQINNNSKGDGLGAAARAEEAVVPSNKLLSEE